MSRFARNAPIARRIEDNNKSLLGCVVAANDHHGKQAKVVIEWACIRAVLDHPMDRSGCVWGGLTNEHQSL
jgi:hypothetical protein